MAPPSKRQTRPAGAGLDPKLQAIYENLEILNGARGKGLDRAVLMRDLLDLDLATVRRAANGVLVPVKPGIGAGIGDLDLVEAPEIPKGVMVAGGFSTILVEWDKPTYKGHAYTEILRSDTDDFSKAVKISTTTANLYSDQVGGNKTAFYWVRFVNRIDVIGPVQSTNGVRGETQADIGEMLDKLRGNIDETFLTPIFNSKFVAASDLSKSNEAMGLLTRDLSKSNEKTIDLNSEKILTINGNVIGISETQQHLKEEADILAEATMSAAHGVDSEGFVRRKAVAEIKLTQKTLITDTGAMAKQILTITAKVGDNGASIIETKSALVKLDKDTKATNLATSQRINQQSSRIDTANSKITANSVTIVTKGKEITEAVKSIANLKGSTDNAIASISTRLNTQKSEIDGAVSSITTNSQTLTVVDGKATKNANDITATNQSITSVSERLDTLTTTVGTNKASITDQQQTMVIVANAARTAQTSANTANGVANGNKLDITAMSQRLTTVESNANGVSAKVTQNTQTIATINADGSTAYKALWGVKASVGDITAGIGLTVSGDKSQVTVVADQFSIGSRAGSSKTIYPFIIEGGKVVIDTAYIKAAKIQDLVAGAVVADTIKATATLTAPRIKGGTIQIGSNFTVDSNGNLRASSAVISGNITATSGTFTGRIQASSGYFTGKVTATSGVFRGSIQSNDGYFGGTIYANKIVGDIYKTIQISIAARSVSGSFILYDKTIPRQAWNRYVEYALVLINSDSAAGFEAVYYLNGTIILKQAVKGSGVVFLPPRIQALPANVAGRMQVRIHNVHSGADMYIPAQSVRVSSFKR